MRGESGPCNLGRAARSFCLRFLGVAPPHSTPLKNLVVLDHLVHAIATVPVLSLIRPISAVHEPCDRNGLERVDDCQDHVTELETVARVVHHFAFVSGCMNWTISLNAWSFA